MQTHQGKIQAFFLLLLFSLESERAFIQTFPKERTKLFLSFKVVC